METDVTIREVMTREYVGVTEGDDVLGAVQLMRDEQAACVLVLRGATPVGIVTEWDVLGLVADELDPAETPVSDVMSSPLVSVEPDRGLADATSVMAREGIRHLLVSEDGETLGVLTERDVIAAVGARPVATNGGEETVGAETAARDDWERADAEAELGGFDQQGICEVCGSLAETLWERNGQLVCADCQGV